MKRTLILDTKGEALASTSEEFDRLNIMIAEQDLRAGGRIPAQKFVIYGTEALKELQKFISNILISKNELRNLQEEHKLLTDKRMITIDGTPEQVEVSNQIKTNREKYNKLIKR